MWHFCIFQHVNYKRCNIGCFSDMSRSYKFIINWFWSRYLFIIYLFARWTTWNSTRFKFFRSYVIHLMNIHLIVELISAIVALFSFAYSVFYSCMHSLYVICDENLLIFVRPFSDLLHHTTFIIIPILIKFLNIFQVVTVFLREPLDVAYVI